jgi:hypothetical protein
MTNLYNRAPFTIFCDSLKLDVDYTGLIDRPIKKEFRKQLNEPAVVSAWGRQGEFGKLS